MAHLRQVRVARQLRTVAALRRGWLGIGRAERLRHRSAVEDAEAMHAADLQRACKRLLHMCLALELFEDQAEQLFRIGDVCTSFQGMAPKMEVALLVSL